MSSNIERHLFRNFLLRSRTHPVGRNLEAIFGVERDPAVAPCKIAKARAFNLDYLRAHFGAQRSGTGLRDQNPC